MASSSSTSSSKLLYPPAGFPWALVGAGLILVAVEVLFRLAAPTKVIPYSSNALEEHLAVANYLSDVRPADVGFIGSSMTREGVAAPLVREQLQSALGRRVYVANYGASALVADEANAIVRYMLQHRTVSRLLIYEVGLHHFRPSISSRATRVAIFWSLRDWFEDWAQSGKPATRVLPVVIRHEVGQWWRTLRYGRQLEHWAGEWLGLAKGSRVPMRGDHSGKWRSKANLAANSTRRESLVRRWVGGHLRGGRYAKMDPELVQCLEQTLQMCRDHHISLVLYEVPLSASVRAKVPPKVYEEFYALIDQLASTYGVPFYRLADLELQFGDEHFADATHMNRHGATLLTEALTEKVILPRLASGKEGIQEERPGRDPREHPQNGRGYDGRDRGGARAAAGEL
ncbi:MAG: hypothetical protein ACM359_13250 [Bacillota bacterium]